MSVPKRISLSGYGPKRFLQLVQVLLPNHMQPSLSIFRRNQTHPARQITLHVPSLSGRASSRRRSARAAHLRPRARGRVSASSLSLVTSRQRPIRHRLNTS